MSKLKPLVVFIVLVGLFNCLQYVNAVDYVFTINDAGAVPCPGKEEDFIDSYFDSSNLKVDLHDDGIIILNGYTVFLKELDPNAIYRIKIDILKLSSGRWIETAFGIERENVCKSLFSKHEIWYEFIKDLQGDARACPPKKAVKYEFNEKTVITLIRQVTPGLEGTYRIIINVESPANQFCIMLEGDSVRKRGTKI